MPAFCLPGPVTRRVSDSSRSIRSIHYPYCISKGYIHIVYLYGASIWCIRSAYLSPAPGHDCLPGCKAGLHIDQALVAAAAENMLFGEQILYKRTVYQDIDVPQCLQGGLSRSPLQERFKGPARIAPDGQAFFAGGIGQNDHGGGLQEGVAARERDAVELACRAHLFGQLLRSGLLSARGIPGLRILTAGTVMGAALKKHHIPYARTVHTGVADRASDPASCIFTLCTHILPPSWAFPGSVLRISSPNQCPGSVLRIGFPDHLHDLRRRVRQICRTCQAQLLPVSVTVENSQ